MKDFFALFLDQLYKNLKELDSGTLEVIPNDSSQHFMLAVLPPLMSMVRQRNPELPLFLKGLFKVSLQQAPFLDGADLTGANFADADFEEISFRQAILINGNLSRGNFRGANFQLANLAGTLIENADLSEASLNLANLAKARLRGTRLNKADLEGASLIWADLTKTDLSNAHLKGANLNEAIATNAKFIRANLSGADLTGIMVAGAEFTGANLVGAILDRIIDLDKAKLDDAIISDNEWKYIQKLGIYERVSLKTEEREALIAKKWIRAEDPRHLYKLKRNGELNKDIASVFTIKRTREVGNRVTHWKFYYASVGINTLFVNYSRNVTKE